MITAPNFNDRMYIMVINLKSKYINKIKEMKIDYRNKKGKITITFTEGGYIFANGVFDIENVNYAKEYLETQIKEYLTL